MATKTLVTPAGTKMRTATARRYVVVVEHVVGKPFVAYRTDDLGRAKARLRAKPYRSDVFDTLTGGIV